eukprot:895925-Rhodomonas_salina.1
MSAAVGGRVCGFQAEEGRRGVAKLPKKTMERTPRRRRPIRYGETRSLPGRGREMLRRGWSK